MNGNSVDERLARLERENRRLKRWGGLVVVMLVALVGMGQAAPEIVAELVKARRFQVVDDSGKVRAEMGMVVGGNIHIALYDRNGAVTFEVDSAGKTSVHDVPPPLFEPDPNEPGGMKVEPGKTPEETFSALQKVCRAHDFDALMDLVAPDDLAEMEANWAEMKSDPDQVAGIAEEIGISVDDAMKLNGREFFVAMITYFAEEDSEEFEKILYAEVLSVEIDGDDCEVTWGTEDDSEEIEMIRVDGRWYLTGLGM